MVFTCCLLYQPMAVGRSQNSGKTQLWGTLLLLYTIVSEDIMVISTTVKSWASSKPVYYSILEIFGQRSQYISIKFPLRKQSENAWVCYFRDSLLLATLRYVLVITFWGTVIIKFCHLNPFENIAKMALFTLCMEFDFLGPCKYLCFIHCEFVFLPKKKCPKLCPTQ